MKGTYRGVRLPKETLYRIPHTYRVTSIQGRTQRVTKDYHINRIPCVSHWQEEHLKVIPVSSDYFKSLVLYRYGKTSNVSVKGLKSITKLPVITTMEEHHRCLRSATTPTSNLYATDWQCIHKHPVTRGHVGRS